VVLFARLKLSSLAFVPLPKWLLVGHQMRLLSLLNLHLMREAATPLISHFPTLRQVQRNGLRPHTRGHITVPFPWPKTPLSPGPFANLNPLAPTYLRSFSFCSSTLGADFTATKFFNMLNSSPACLMNIWPLYDPINVCIVCTVVLSIMVMQIE